MSAPGGCRPPIAAQNCLATVQWKTMCDAVSSGSLQIVQMASAAQANSTEFQMS
jgi:hypothetical protein